MVDTANSVALDLGVADVHAPAAAGKMTPVKGKSKRGAVEKKPNRKARRMAKLRLAWTHADGSTMTVRHMTDSADALHLMTELSDKDGADGKPVWIQIAKTGEFKGHPQGAFQLNSKVFGEIIANFNATQNRQVAIDFEHWSESNNPLIAQVGAPAQGWIRELQIVNGDLFGLVEWNERAREMIRAKEYKFLSPAIVFKSKDRVTNKELGAQLRSAALTNKPFLDGMLPLAASEGAAQAFAESVPPAVATLSCYSPDDYMPAVRVALGLPPLATAEQCAEQIDCLRCHLDAVDGNASATHEGVKLSDYLVPLREIVKAGPAQSWDDVLDSFDVLLGSDTGSDGETDMPTDTIVTPAVETPAPVIETPAAAVVATDAPAAPVVTASDAPAVVEPAKVEPAAVVAPTPEVADLTLKLSTSVSEIETLRAELETFRAEKAAKELADKAAAEARLLSERTSVVDATFDSYATKYHWEPTIKAHLMTQLVAAPEAFATMFPTVDADKRHLLKNLAGGDEVRTLADTANPAPTDALLEAAEKAAKGAPTSFDISARAAAIVCSQGVSMQQAQLMAERESLKS